MFNTKQDKKVSTKFCEEKCYNDHVNFKTIKLMLFFSRCVLVLISISNNVDLHGKAS